MKNNTSKEKQLKINRRRIERKISKFKKNQKLGRLGAIPAMRKAIAIRQEIFQFNILQSMPKPPNFKNGYTANAVKINCEDKTDYLNKTDFNI